MTNMQIEKQADEAYVEFIIKWHAVADEAGSPTAIEVWHHAWRACLKTVGANTPVAMAK